MWKQAICASLLALLLLPSCTDGENPPGTVEIGWQLDKTTCSLAGVVDVQIELIQPNELPLGETARCGDGTVTIEAVPPGVYDVLIQGLDANEKAIYEGSYKGLKVRSGPAVTTLPPMSGSKTPQKVVLSTKKAGIGLRWGFANSQSALCTFNNVAQVEVNVLQGNTNDGLFTGTFPCDPLGSGIKLEDLPAPIVDGWVVISNLPSGSVKLIVFGLSPAGKRVSMGEETLELEIGILSKTTILLEECRGGECI